MRCLEMLYRSEEVSVFIEEFSPQCPCPSLILFTAHNSRSTRAGFVLKRQEERERGHYVGMFKMTTGKIVLD